MKEEHQAEEEGLASLDRSILPRAFALFAVAAATAIAGEMVAPRLLGSSNVAVRYAGAVASALAVGGVGFAFIGLALATAAAASQASRRLRARGVSRLTIRVAVVLSLTVCLAALFFFLPFCLGSLREGTYDCIPLGTRVTHWLGSGPS